MAFVMIAGLGTPAFAGFMIEEPGGETITFEFTINVTSFGFGETPEFASVQEVEIGDLITGMMMFDISQFGQWSKKHIED